MMHSLLSLRWGQCMVVGALLGGGATALADFSFVNQSQIATHAGIRWTDEVSFQPFDAALGTLDHIDLRLDWELSGIQRYENASQRSVGVTLLEWSTISLSRPDQTCLAGAKTSAGFAGLIPRFDGVLDYAGTSGGTLPVSDLALRCITLSGAGDLALFSGAAPVELPVSAGGLSFVAFLGGYGAAGFSTQTTAKVSLSYAYVPVPEPTTWTLLTGLALGGYALCRQTRRSRG